MAAKCAVVPLPDAEFYHFGTSAQMIEAVSELQNLVLDESKVGRTGARQQPDQVFSDVPTADDADRAPSQLPPDEGIPLTRPQLSVALRYAV